MPTSMQGIGARWGQHPLCSLWTSDYSSLPFPSEKALVSTADVRNTLLRINVNIPCVHFPDVLNDPSDTSRKAPHLFQNRDQCVFTREFWSFLSQQLAAYVSLTPIFIKCFEKLVVQHVKDPQMDCTLSRRIHRMSSLLSPHMTQKVTAPMSPMLFDKLSSLGLSITYCKCGPLLGNPDSYDWQVHQKIRTLISPFPTFAHHE